MKIFFATCGLIFLLAGCAGNNENKTSTEEGAGSGNPSAIDTTKHPSGMSHSNVISTDTAAMRIDSFQQK
jgi:hypothetical protein